MRHFAPFFYLLATLCTVLFISSHVVGTQVSNWGRYYPLFHWSLFSSSNDFLSESEIILDLGDDRPCVIHQCEPQMSLRKIVLAYRTMRYFDDNAEKIIQIKMIIQNDIKYNDIYFLQKPVRIRDLINQRMDK